MKNYCFPMEWVSFKVESVHFTSKEKSILTHYFRRRSIERVTFGANGAVIDLLINGNIVNLSVTTESAQAFIDSENQAGDQ